MHAKKTTTDIQKNENDALGEMCFKKKGGMRLNKKRMAAQCQSWIPGPVPDKDGMEGGRRPHSTQRNNQKTGILCSNDHALSFLVLERTYNF